MRALLLLYALVALSPSATAADGRAAPERCPSARINIPCARYDYRYDAHDRLIRADYTPADGADEDEDFSVQYRYDRMARPTDVERIGIVDVDADGKETFGDLDALRYSYDDAGRVAEIENGPDGTDYYGRPGFPTAGSLYSWDAAGRMTADTGRDITRITYDHRNLPKDIAFGDGRHIQNFYDADGALIRTVLIPRVIVDVDADGKETFGDLDHLRYSSYDWDFPEDARSLSASLQII